MYKCLSLSICVSYLFVCKVLLEECVYVCLSIYLFILSVCLLGGRGGVCLFLCLSACLSFYLSVCLSICLSVECRKRSVMRISCPVLCPATDSCCLPPSSSVWQSWPPWESRTRTVETRWVDSGVRCSAVKLENRLGCQTASMRTSNCEQNQVIFFLLFYNILIYFSLKCLISCFL